MISMGLYWAISSIIFFALLIMSVARDEGGGWAFFFALIAIIVFLTNTPNKEDFVKYNEYEIHSTAGNYNNISGSFFLGSGYINSQEMYTGNVFDGKFYDRMYIPVNQTRRTVVNHLTDRAIYKMPMCKYEDTLFKHKTIFTCSEIKGILEVPKGTIVQQLNFQ